MLIVDPDGEFTAFQSRYPRSHDAGACNEEGEALQDLRQSTPAIEGDIRRAQSRLLAAGIGQLRPDADRQHSAAR